MFLILRGCFVCMMHIKSPKTAFLYAFSCGFGRNGALDWLLKAVLLHIKLKKINFYMHVFNSARLFCLCNAYKKRKNGFFICVVMFWKVEKALSL